MYAAADVVLPQSPGCKPLSHYERPFPQNRSNRMLHTLSIFISVIYPLLCCSGNDILPEPLKLRVRQRIAITIWNNILRSGICLCFSQAVCQADGEGNVSLRRLCFQFIRMTGRLLSVCHALRTVRYGVSVSKYTESHCRARISSLRNPAYRPSITNTYGGSP